MSFVAILTAAVISFAALVLLSIVVERVRRAPSAPNQLVWAPSIPIQYADVGELKLRFIRAGTGPNLVLLHTLRTQLDLFEKVVLGLTPHFTVYAVDYPGHGYSSIPDASYDADFFVHAIERFLETQDLREVTLCGVSIGASIALILAGRHNPRVARVVAINPYDYAKGRGLARASFFAWVTVLAAPIPMLGDTVMRLRNFAIMKAIFEGGVANRENFPLALIKEMYVVGNRRGHYRAFTSLLRHGASWERSTDVYPKINVPVSLVWGDEDWATSSEREHDHQLLANAPMTTVDDGGHFLPLDCPQQVQELIIRFAGRRLAVRE